MSWVCSAAKIEARAAIPAVSALASPLAGTMLRSYLDGAITSRTVADIAAAVQRNSTYDKIVAHVQAKVQDWVNAMGYLPSEAQLRDLIDDAINTFRMDDPGAAAAASPSSLPARAYFSGDLQAVIGGINPSYSRA